ncbi:unnamed protein product [Caenorhabditis bovis]|uniref:Uncharacterized protein n=1 Tax=Caenorhabditis bovis TaxID=2654633 RepID=A0A8S1EUF4_9PELO|nr:unnamed protein product [Caenorhabditis bovis]
MQANDERFVEYFRNNYTKCNNSFDYFDSPQFQSTYSHAILMVSLPLNVFAGWCIYSKTPSHFRSAKWYLLNLHAWIIIVDVLISGLLNPFLFFLVLGGVTTGLLERVFGVPAAIQTLMAQIGFAGLGVSIIMIFENRHNLLVRGPLKIENWQIRIAFYSINALYGIAFAIPIYMNIPDQKWARLKMLELLPCPHSDYFTKDIFIVSTDPLFVTKTFLTLLIFYVIESFSFAFHSSFFLWSINNHMSYRTRQMQRKFFIDTCIQVAVPIFAIISPFFYVIYSIIYSYYNQMYNNIVIILLSFHGFSSTATLIIRSPAYRDYFCHVFFRRKYTKKNHVVESMSIGIDLGTTFSCVAHYRNGKVEVLENENGCRTTPSVIAVDEDGEWLIGQTAKDVVSNPTNCLFDVKRVIGRRYDDVLLQKDMPLWPFRLESDGADPYFVVESGSHRHRFTAVTASAHILASLKKNAERKLGFPVKNAVVTVPAYFNSTQRQATQEAAKLAGFNVLRILNEPTAAAIAYSLDGKRLSRRNILIYDFGGGTFDVAIVNINGPHITVKAKGGDAHLGGQDIDNIVMLKMLEKFKTEKKIDLKTNYRALKRLRKAAENAKITLSSSGGARIELECIHENIDFIMKINRKEFEGWIDNVLLSTMIHVERAIREAGLQKSQIDEIVLVGGSTRIPRLKTIIRSSFPESTKICESIHPDEAVAHGAAITAAILSGVEDVQDMRMNDIIPMSIGIQCNRDYMSVLIKKGTCFPCFKKKIFVNSEDYQTKIDIDVYEGERVLCSNNRHLGNITMDIEPMRRGESVVEICMEVDHNGILQATAIDKKSNKAITTTILYDHCTFTKEEIDEMTKHTEEDRMFDERFRKRYKQLQSSEDLAYDYKHRLEKITASIDKEKYTKLMDMITDEIRWLADFPNVSCDEYQSRRHTLRRKVLPTLLLNLSF